MKKISIKERKLSLKKVKIIKLTQLKIVNGGGNSPLVFNISRDGDDSTVHDTLSQK